MQELCRHPSYSWFLVDVVLKPLQLHEHYIHSIRHSHQSLRIGLKKGIAPHPCVSTGGRLSLYPNFRIDGTSPTGVSPVRYRLHLHIKQLRRYVLVVTPSKEFPLMLGSVLAWLNFLSISIGILRTSVLNLYRLCSHFPSFCLDRKSLLRHSFQISLLCRD